MWPPQATCRAKLKPGYKPPDTLTKCMLDAMPALPNAPQLEYILDECTPIAEHRRKVNGNVLEFDETLAVVLYTYDLGAMGNPTSNENFFYIFNPILRTRDTQALFALQPTTY